MPKGAKVFLVEDNDDFRETEKLLLTKSGHTVVLEARTLRDAMEKVKEAREKGVNVAVLDGSLNDSVASRDGATIAEALRKDVPGIKIVSCSGLTWDWGDNNLWKGDVEKIGRVVTALKN